MNTARDCRLSAPKDCWFCEDRAITAVYFPWRSGGWTDVCGEHGKPVSQWPKAIECRCQDCAPDEHADCSADCLIWDCSSSWACCNSDCDNLSTGR